ncbi:MAG: sulfopyruvate decarboxylase [Dehalococcoidia bacterium]
MSRKVVRDRGPGAAVSRAARAPAGRPVPEYTRQFMAGLHDANVSLIAALPESLLKSIYRECEADPSLRYVLVSNEADLPGIIAGTYLAGRRGLMIMENSGIRQCCEPVARFAFCHGMPLVMVMSYRGEFGERNWWGHNHSQVMVPLLAALRIPMRVISRPEELRDAIGKAFTHADASQWPVALVLTGDCTEMPSHATN